MTKSMTGYGRGQRTIDNFDILVEIRSVNHRYADFNFRVPRHYGFLEEHIKNHLKNYISRGKVDVTVSVHRHADDSKEIVLNDALAKSYIDALRRLSTEFGVRDDISVSTVARFGDIFDSVHKEDDEDALLARVLAVTDEAAAAFTDTRAREGAKLAADMLARNSSIRAELTKIEEIAPRAAAEYREKIERRVKELLGDCPIDENRLLTETAIYADRVCVAEELTRLHSHLDEFDRAAALDGPIGRRLDFLLQEMNREINTIGAKANHLDAAKVVVNIKSELEKIREQLQNIE
ncbi:MAG: YicC family protein [Clostridiales bacterium]|jgi:uncharacterized protein (TIGR00255 family)|nr:YicC family protein [Clostridiales bacterium]